MQKDHPRPDGEKRAILTTDSAIPLAVWNEARQRLAAHSLSLNHQQLRQRPSAEDRQALAGAHALIVDALNVDRNIISAASRCVAVIRVGDGYDNIDLDAATEQGIICCNQPGIWSYETAEYAFLLGLMQLRCIPQLMTDHLRPPGGTRPFRQLIADYAPIRTAASITVGVVGFGRIGREVCRLYSPLAKRILVSDSHATPADLDRFAQRHNARAAIMRASLADLLAESDIITLHIPMRHQNRHLLSDAEFASMKSTAVIVNCARGPLIDSDALYRAVSAKRIAAAALDLTDPDPLPADHPLRQHERICITPHFAWYSDDAVRRMRASIVDTVIALCERRIPSCALNADRIPRPRMRIFQQ